MSKRLISSVLLIVSLLLSACAKEEITAENIVTKMREAQTATTDMHAVVRLDYTSPDQTGFISAEYWTRKTGTKDEAGNEVSAVRLKVLDASETDMVGSEAVFDGTQGWLYSPTENTAYVGNKADIEANKPESGAGGGPTSQTEMLLQLQGFVQKGLDAVNIEILGEEQVAGANAYKLKISPKPEAQSELQLPIELLVDITVWVDSTRWMPLKLIVDAKDMGKVEIAAQTLDINSGVDAAQFSAQPPAGAKIVQIADLMKDMQKSDVAPTTLEEARAQAGFPLLTAPNGTIGAALVEVQTIKLPQGSAVVQSFSGAGVEWSLVQSQGDASAMARGNRGGTVVDVRGVKGTIIEGKGNVGTLLTWQEGDVTFVVAGNISAEDALAAAAALK
jgi:outer membrane lipoprotein-sorting protein